MGKGTIKTKAMTMAVAMSMVAGLCPSTVFAANSEDVAKVQDGTYTGTAECTPDEYEEFEKYDLSVEVTIENGVIKSIGNIKGNGAEDNNTYITNAANGTKKDPTGVVQQIIDANGTDGINAVSRATCSSKAIVEAVNNALEEATKKEENKEEKTEDLQAVITKAEDLSEADYTAESWKTMQDALTAAKDALEKKKSQTAVDSAKDTLNAEIAAFVKKTPDVQKEVYVLMNIPYADFYKADGVTGADAVSSATKQKTRASLAAGSYHVNSDGSDITGVTFPVKISDASVLEKYMQITDDSKVDITTSIKGKKSTTTYKGKDALFESASYSYYILSDTPSYYKEATVENGNVSFGKNVNEKEVKEISEKMKTHYQKVGIVKYDAFHEMGGELSFALTMLDENNNGWIFNAMHSREGCYTYVKEIVKGESYVELAEEEAEALDKAIFEDGYEEEVNKAVASVTGSMKMAKSGPAKTGNQKNSNARSAKQVSGKANNGKILNTRTSSMRPDMARPEKNRK